MAVVPVLWGFGFGRGCCAASLLRALRGRALAVLAAPRPAWPFCLCVAVAGFEFAGSAPVLGFRFVRCGFRWWAAKCE